MSGYVIRRQIVCKSRERNQAIQRAAVEQMPAHVPGDRTADRSLARAARTIDGYEAGVGHRSICRPTSRALATKFGKDVATLATSRISMGPRARTAAVAKAIAMR
jgi:hypothetical protein